MGMRPTLAPLILAALSAASLCLPSSEARADFIDHFATQEDTGVAKVPALGDSRILVLTIEVEGFEPLDMDAIRAFFAEDPAPGEANFTDFYTRMSLGAYRPVAEVIEPIRFETCPLPEDYFGFANCSIPRNGRSDTGDPNDALDTLTVGIELLEEIIRRADEERGVDFSSFDINGLDGEPDGAVDGVLLLHNINFGGIALPVYFLRGEGPIEVDGVTISMVGVAETERVALHEFGHLLGWADLYDESRQTQGYHYSAMGAWLYETDPPAMDGFTRSVAGWVEPQIVREGDALTDLRLSPAADSGQVIQILEGEEFYILENRGPEDGDYMDGDLTERGLIITHVNLRRYPKPTDGTWPLRLLNCVNCFQWDPMLMNEQADGKFHLQKRGTRRKDSEDMFLPGDVFKPNPINFLPLGTGNQAFSSNLYDGTVTGVRVDNIRIDGDDIIVDIRVDEPCSLITCRSGTCEAGRCVSALDPDPTPNPDPTPEPISEPTSKPSSGGCQTVPGGGGGGGGLPWVSLVLIGLVWRRI